MSICIQAKYQLDYQRKLETKAENLWDGCPEKDMWNNKKREDGMWTYWRNSSSRRISMKYYGHAVWPTLGMWLAWKRTDIQISWCMGTHMDDDLEGDQGEDGWTTSMKIMKRWNWLFNKRQSEMEKYCPQQGLPEHGNIVFVAEALKSSQVNKA